MQKQSLTRTSLVILSLMFGGTLCWNGCTSAQVKETETDLVKILQTASNALSTLNNNPSAIADAELALSAVAAIAPQTGSVHQAIVDAQAALNALQRNQGTLVSVQTALQVVIDLLEKQNTIPKSAVHHTISKSR